MTTHTHDGVRDTNADKRRRVEAALRDPEMITWSSRRIADHCRVSHETVCRLRGADPRASESDSSSATGGEAATIRPALRPAGTPTLPALAAALDAATARHDEAEAAARSAAGALDRAEAAIREAVNLAMSAPAALMHGGDPSGPGRAAEAVKAKQAALIEARAARLATAAALAEATADRAAAGVAVAKAMDAAGLKFARWGDRLIVDETVHHPPVDRALTNSFQAGRRLVDLVTPPSTWAASIVALPDVEHLVEHP